MQHQRGGNLHRPFLMWCVYHSLLSIFIIHSSLSVWCSELLYLALHAFILFHVHFTRYP